MPERGKKAEAKQGDAKPNVPLRPTGVATRFFFPEGCRCAFLTNPGGIDKFADSRFCATITYPSRLLFPRRSTRSTVSFALEKSSAPVMVKQWSGKSGIRKVCAVSAVYLFSTFLFAFDNEAGRDSRYRVIQTKVEFVVEIKSRAKYRIFV